MRSKQQYFGNSEGSEPEPTCCKNSPGVFHNRRDGRRIRSKCNTWGCEYCGPIKKNRLLDEVAYGSSVIQQNGRRWRFMTLTTSPRSDQSKVSKYFAEFRAYLAEYGFRPQYFKVTEINEKGLRHFHLLIDVFVPFGLIQAAWRASTDDTAYWVNIKKAQVKQAAGYMAKYMTKQTVFSSEFRDGEHRYSFSKRFPRFQRPIPSGEWEFRLNPMNGGQLQEARAELAARAAHRRSWSESWSEATGDPPGHRRDPNQIYG